ncbi:hypothetical protein OG992_31890 [Micromonospora sp. NBC_00362]|uniref:hypothetical protein n=1 Tax=Micromonospora sp. NBC_00362 TaxID=2975975 RepID=UPI00225466A2|nr:hypothetical protein [Micromonospora sp. NBC_00362]MCX5121772.1 hypothetical protein [Micromonospora sp. NBC_00362]
MLLDVPAEELLPLMNAAGGNRLPILDQLDPWSDGALSREDLPQLDVEVDRLEAAAGNDVERGPVAATRAFLPRWRWYGD